MGKSLVICCTSFPPEKGGAPSRIYNMAVLLRDNGYDVTVITAMPNYPTGAIFPGYRGRLIAKETIDGIKVIRLWLMPSNSASLLLRGLSLVSHLLSFLLLASPRLLLKKSAGIIISSPPLVNAWLAAVLARLAGKTIIVNVSDIWPLTASEMGALRQGFFFGILQKIERQLYRKASAFTGQSEEILDHISRSGLRHKPSFLYRNLQTPGTVVKEQDAQSYGRLLYAGNLGHAQGMAALCAQVNFAAMGVCLDIYGDGAEKKVIQEFIDAHPGCGIQLKPTISQQALNQQLYKYSAVLIPLKTTIAGAVPSKLFMAVANRLPVLFCGGGEGARLVIEHELGLVSEPGDFETLETNIKKLLGRGGAQRILQEEKIYTASEGIFNKAVQDASFILFLNEVLQRKK